jgi:hypothetical protein
MLLDHGFAVVPFNVVIGIELPWLQTYSVHLDPELTLGLMSTG